MSQFQMFFTQPFDVEWMFKLQSYSSDAELRF
jgi:hypothetical protein